MIGNPTSDGIWSYEWEVGRRLKSMSAEGTALNFKYDHNGLRTQKIVQQDWYPVTTNYLLHGKLITHMTVNYHDWEENEQQDTLHFFYDTQSRPAKVSFNGVIYTYIHNLLGDIIGLLDSTGNLVVEYKYDAWGKLLATSGTMADTLGKRNPFRYRGYVYDEESGMYYLRSRYYNPEWGRFVNMDSCIGVLHQVFCANLFAYCLNTPVNTLDANGHAAQNANTNNIYVYKAFEGVYYMRYYTRPARPANANSTAAKLVAKLIDLAVILAPVAREAALLKAAKGAAGLQKARNLAGRSARAIRDILSNEQSRALKSAAKVAVADSALELVDSSIGEIVVGAAIRTYNTFDEAASGWHTRRILNPSVELDPSAYDGEIIYMCEPPLTATPAPTAAPTSAPITPMPGPSPAPLY